MNKEEILAMKAGRELDTLVVEKVFAGSKDYFIPDWSDVNWPYKWDMDGNDVAFKPSTDISDAWEVVDKLNHDGKHLVWHENKKQWCFIFGKGTWGRWSAYGDTAPEAICKAALLAVMNL